MPISLILILDCMGVTDMNDFDPFQNESPVCFTVVNKELWIPETIFLRIIHILNAYQLHFGQVLDPYGNINSVRFSRG